MPTRKNKAIARIIGGSTIREAANDLGYTEEKLLSILQETFSSEDPISLERSIEGERLLKIIQSRLSDAIDGDNNATRITMTAIELRSKILGLNAPTRTEVTGKDGGAMQFEFMVSQANQFLEDLGINERDIIDANVIDAAPSLLPELNAQSEDLVEEALKEYDTYEPWTKGKRRRTMNDKYFDSPRADGETKRESYNRRRRERAADIRDGKEVAPIKPRPKRTKAYQEAKDKS